MVLMNLRYAGKLTTAIDIRLLTRRSNDCDRLLVLDTDLNNVGVVVSHAPCEPELLLRVEVRDLCGLTEQASFLEVCPDELGAVMRDHLPRGGHIKLGPLHVGRFSLMEQYDHQHDHCRAERQHGGSDNLVDKTIARGGE